MDRTLSRPFDPVRLLVNLNLAAKVWFGLFLLMAGFEAATLFILLHPKTMGEQSVLFVAGDGRGYAGNFVQLGGLTNMHIRVAEDVTLAFLSRNPADFDQPDRINLLFQPEAARQARSDCEQGGPDRKARQLHEKPEITRLQYLEASNQRILFNVQGQLIKAGAFGGQPILSAESFELHLELVPNSNLSLQAAFPLVVQRFRYEIIPR